MPTQANLPGVTLHVCTTCRKVLARGLDPAAPVDTVLQLEAAAGQRALDAGIALACARTTCLSGCQTGLTVMIETQEGMVRLQKLASAQQAADAVSHARELVDGEQVAGLTVLSRVKWSEWEAE